MIPDITIRNRRDVEAEERRLSGHAGTYIAIDLDEYIDDEPEEPNKPSEGPISSFTKPTTGLTAETSPVNAQKDLDNEGSGRRERAEKRCLVNGRNIKKGIGIRAAAAGLTEVLRGLDGV